MAQAMWGVIRQFRAARKAGSRDRIGSGGNHVETPRPVGRRSRLRRDRTRRWPPGRVNQKGTRLHPTQPLAIDQADRTAVSDGQCRLITSERAKTSSRSHPLDRHRRERVMAARRFRRHHFSCRSPGRSAQRRRSAPGRRFPSSCRPARTSGVCRSENRAGGATRRVGPASACRAAC